MKANPFKFGPIVAGAYFTDREQERAALLSNMISGQNVTIISPRRYGKSSLINGAMEDFREQGGLVSYVDVYGLTSREQLVRVLGDAFYRELARWDERSWHEAVKFLERIQPHIKLEMKNSEVVGISLNPGLTEADINLVLEETLAMPGKIAAKRNRQVAVVLDEFQAVVDIDNEVPGTMRKVFQRQSNVCHICAGSRQALMTKLFFDNGQPMYNFARRVLLERISADRFEKFVSDGFVSTGVGIDLDALARLLELTEGHPYQTQELASYVWFDALSAGKAADPAMVDAAHESVLGAETGRFVEIWDSLAAGPRKLLTAVATDPGQAIQGQEFLKRHTLGAASSAQSSAALLVERGLLEKVATGRYVVPDSYLRLWLQRRASRPMEAMLEATLAVSGQLTVQTQTRNTRPAAAGATKRRTGRTRKP